MILLCILFVFFLSICMILFILCKRKKKQLITDAIYFLFDQEIIWGWRTGCACVYVRRVNDREACIGGAVENGLNLVLCVFYSLSSSWGTGFDSECIALKKQLIVSFKKTKTKNNFRHLKATCCLLCNQTFTNFSDQQLLKIQLSLSQQGLEV